MKKHTVLILLASVSIVAAGPSSTNQIHKPTPRGVSTNRLTYAERRQMKIDKGAMSEQKQKMLEEMARKYREQAANLPDDVRKRLSYAERRKMKLDKESQQAHKAIMIEELARKYKENKGKGEVSSEERNARLRDLNMDLIREGRSSINVPIVLTHEMEAQKSKQPVAETNKLTSAERRQLKLDAIARDKLESEKEKKASMTLMVARKFVEKARKVEEEGGKEESEKLRKHAIPCYQDVIIYGDVKNPAVLNHIKEALFECIPLLIESGKLKQAGKYCERYLKLFPEDPNKARIRDWLKQAMPLQSTTVKPE